MVSPSGASVSRQACQWKSSESTRVPSRSQRTAPFNAPSPASLPLPVVGRRAVLARMMLVDEARVGTRGVGIERADAPLQTGDELQRLGPIDRLERIGAPGER